MKVTKTAKKVKLVKGIVISIVGSMLLVGCNTVELKKIDTNKENKISQMIDEKNKVKEEEIEEKKTKIQNVRLGHGEYVNKKGEKIAVELIMAEGTTYTEAIGDSYEENYEGICEIRLLRNKDIIDKVELMGTKQYIFDGVFEIPLADYNEDNRISFLLGEKSDRKNQEFTMFYIEKDQIKPYSGENKLLISTQDRYVTLLEKNEVNDLFYRVYNKETGEIQKKNLRIIEEEILSYDTFPLETYEVEASYHKLIITPASKDYEEKKDAIKKDERLNALKEELSTTYFNFEKNQIAEVKVPNSIYVLTNKLNHLPENYVPSDLVKPDVRFSFAGESEKAYLREKPAKALEELFEAGDKEGIYLFALSGYRSYNNQKRIYDGFVAGRGVEATDKISARPGHSEHQTGLTMDVTTESVNFRLSSTLGKKKEGIWIAEHAHEFGFIVRYLEDRTNITGYSYEPWHLRYVGKEVATVLYEYNLSLEELYTILYNE